MIRVDIANTSPIRIFWASAAGPNQQCAEYNGTRSPDQLAAVLAQYRSAPGGWACALIYTHTHAMGTKMARDCETNDICAWDGSI